MYFKLFIRKNEHFFMDPSFNIGIYGVRCKWYYRRVSRTIIFLVFTTLDENTFLKWLTMEMNINISFLNDLSIVTNIKCYHTSHPKQSLTINQITPTFFFIWHYYDDTAPSPYNHIDLKIHTRTHVCLCACV